MSCIRFEVPLTPARFFETGYQDGLRHGQEHGLFEGKAFGREKGFELWEEIGFYEGFGDVWKEICEREDGGDR